MKVRQGVAIALSGITWMGIGSLLLTKGFSFILIPSSLGAGGALFLPKLSSLVGSAQQASLLLVCVAIFVGFLKGRLVLSRSANRIISRILALPNPCSILSIYPRSYLILLASMMALGMGLKWIPIPYDLRGFIDIAVGSALINGSAFYFRQLKAPKVIKK
jgi:hypothetical protein